MQDNKRAAWTFKYRSSIIWLALFLCVLYGCKVIRPTPASSIEEELIIAREASAEPANRGEEIMLEVNKLKVTRQELYDRFAAYAQQNPSINNDKEAWEKFFSEFTDKLLIISYAQQVQIDTELEFQQELKKARDDLLYQYVIEQEVEPVIEVSEQEIVQYYESHIEEFTTPMKIQVRHILTATLEDAEKALTRLKNNESFAQVAQEMSLHYSRAHGGLLPYFARGTYNKEFEDTAFALNVGQLSKIIRTELGYHIIEKTGEMPARVRTLDEVREEIRQLLHARQKEILLRALIDNLKQMATIKIYHYR